jgi:hypothetical protein
LKLSLSLKQVMFFVANRLVNLPVKASKGKRKVRLTGIEPKRQAQDNAEKGKVSWSEGTEPLSVSLLERSAIQGNEVMGRNAKSGASS